MKNTTNNIKKFLVEGRKKEKIDFFPPFSHDKLTFSSAERTVSGI